MREQTPLIRRFRIHGLHGYNEAQIGDTHQFELIDQLACSCTQFQSSSICRARKYLVLQLEIGACPSAVPLDLHSRAVVGWAMAPYLTAQLATKALEMALARRKPAPGLLHHSDRGVQYAAHDYQRLLERHGITCSMSRRGNCWDNACVESFFSTLKLEHVYHRRYMTREQAKHDLFGWIELIYNRQRRHSKLGYRSPAEFERMAKIA